VILYADQASEISQTRRKVVLISHVEFEDVAVSSTGHPSPLRCASREIRHRVIYKKLEMLVYLGSVGYRA
jgi:hypothetical protein